MESLKRALGNIGRMWSNLTATQRVIVGGAAALMIVLLVVSSLGTSQAWVRVAGPGGDISTVTRKLQERHQKHEVRGAEVFVPKEDAERVFVDLAGEGAATNEAIWDFLKDSNPFLDRRQKDLRYKRALEQMLSAMIRRVEFVRNANVVITLGSESNRLGFEGSRAKASVQVELQGVNKLSNKNVAAIANLVAKSVEGLDPDQVVITDNQLNSYSLPKSDGRAALAQIWRDYEREMEEDIQNRIRAAFRTASVVVRITAKNSTTKTEKTQHSNPKVEEEHERKNIKGVTPASGQGIKGGDVTPPVAESSRETDQETRTRNRFDMLRQEIEDPAGKIEKVTIGVLIPIEVGPDGKELAEAEKQLSKIREWVLAAADAPVNSVTVSFIPSKKPEALPVEETVGALAWVWSHWPKVVLVALSIFAVWVLVRIIQRSTAQDTVEELQALTTALTETQEGPAGITAPAETDLARLRQGIQDMVGRNPQPVAASLKSFMSGR
jgi:flagellar M-ring protein FliF